MVALIIGMLVCVALAVAVVAVVAIPARREGRDLLTPQGEELISAAKDKVTDSLGSIGSGSTPEDTGRHRAG